MTWILLLHKTGALARGLTHQPPSLLISLTDLNLDQHPTLWMPRHLYSGLNYWGTNQASKPPHTRTRFFSCLSSWGSAIPSHPDRCHLGTLVLIWQWLECLANDSINVCSNDILDSSPQLCHLTIPNKISVIKDFASQKQEEIHPLPAKNPEETSNPFPSC